MASPEPRQTDGCFDRPSTCGRTKIGVPQPWLRPLAWEPIARVVLRSRVPAFPVRRLATLTHRREPLMSCASSAGFPGGLSCWREMEGGRYRETG